MMVAASFIVGVGEGVQINVSSDARMRGTDKVNRREKKLVRFSTTGALGLWEPTHLVTIK